MSVGQHIVSRSTTQVHSDFGYFYSSAFGECWQGIGTTERKRKIRIINLKCPKLLSIRHDHGTKWLVAGLMGFAPLLAMHIFTTSVDTI